MRLQLHISPSLTVVPFDHLPVLTGALHKWLGPNHEHGGLSLYSFSWLQGGKADAIGLRFPEGATWMISALDGEFLMKNIKGIMADPGINWGMEVREVTLQTPPVLTEPEFRFLVSSPVLVKTSRPDGTTEHLVFSDPAADEVMTHTMRHKMRVANVCDEGLSLRFDREYPLARTQLVTYRGIDNRANYCPVIARGTPEQLAFVWTVGIGHSTGVGFGGVK